MTTNESVLRFVLLVVAILQSVIGGWYVRRSHAVASIFQRRDEGIPLSVSLGLCYLAYSIGVVAYLVDPKWMAWSAVTLPAWGRWIGVAVLLNGAVLAIWSLTSLARNFAFAVAPQERTELVTTGMYRWVRHPLYTAFLVESIGVSLLMANWFVATAAGLLWTMLVFRTRQEEEKLIERFGDDYLKYMARTGRFLPRREYEADSADSTGNERRR